MDALIHDSIDGPSSSSTTVIDSTLDMAVKDTTHTSIGSGINRSLRKRSNRSYYTTKPPLKKTKTSSSQIVADVRRISQENTRTEEEEEEQKNPSSIQVDSSTENARHLITSWICAECKEAECMIDSESPLLLCEGPCLRLFHFPCARLSSLPPSDEPWICHDCIQQRHKCCVCQEYGIDNIEVYKCDKKTCGLFYHEQCLSMYDFISVHRLSTTTTISTVVVSSSSLQVDIPGKAIKKNTSSLEEHQGINEGVDETLHHNNTDYQPQEARIQDKNLHQAPIMLKFKCPAHRCWTCSGGIPEETLSSNNHVEKQETTCQASNSVSENTTTTTTTTNKAKQSKSLKTKKSSNSSQLKLKTCFNEKLGELIRCMECPNSFHITCIAPKCRFHELALLCHEHAYTNKLPYLDYSNSLQGKVEAKVDEKLTSSFGKKNSLIQSYSSKSALRRENKFLPGLKGDIVTKEQLELEQLLNDHKVVATTGFFPTFYFPVDIKTEVHTKLPSFIQIQINRMDPNNKPKRHPPSTECCQCKVFCDANCLNRIAGLECVGNSKNKSDHANPYRNCNVGPSCGNRLLTSRDRAKCKPVRETGKGWGLVSVHGVKRGNIVLEYVGEIIDEKMKRSRLDAWSAEHPNDPNFYIMSLESGWYIDARDMANLSRFINHSCAPNCQLSRIIVSGYLRIAVIAIKDVAPGEFLSYDYHFDTKDGDKFICRCGAEKCRGTMKGGINNSTSTEAKKKTKKELWLQAKAKLDKDKKFLEDIAQSEKSRLHLGKLYQPGDEKNESGALISSGPQARPKQLIPGGSKVFLWRNAMKGSNFYSRHQKWMLRNSK